MARTVIIEQAGIINVQHSNFSTCPITALISNNHGPWKVKIQDRDA